MEMAQWNPPVQLIYVNKSVKKICTCSTFCEYMKLILQCLAFLVGVWRYLLVAPFLDDWWGWNPFQRLLLTGRDSSLSTHRNFLLAVWLRCLFFLLIIEILYLVGIWAICWRPYIYIYIYEIPFSILSLLLLFLNATPVNKFNFFLQ
jgi:hypothetical protein